MKINNYYIILLFTILLFIFYYCIYFCIKKYNFNENYLQKNIKILLIIGVENSKRNIELILNNYKLFSKYKEIDWCLLHFDGKNTLWENLDWYKNIKYKIIKQGCKAYQWSQINPNITKKYDYLWFCDGDIGFEGFDWKDYYNFLILFNPLLSQPSVKGLNLFSRSSDHYWLIYNKFKSIDIIDKNIEVMTPFISTKLWPLIYEKINLTDKRSIWEIEFFYNNLVKILGKNKYVNHNSYIIHYDFRNLQKNKKINCLRKFIPSNDPTNLIDKILKLKKYI